MATALLTITCRGCGREENIVEFVEDDTIDFNLDKMCLVCGTWMTKQELMLIGTIWATGAAALPACEAAATVTR